MAGVVKSVKVKSIQHSFDQVDGGHVTRSRPLGSGVRSEEEKRLKYSEVDHGAEPENPLVLVSKPLKAIEQVKWPDLKDQKIMWKIQGSTIKIMGDI